MNYPVKRAYYENESDNNEKEACYPLGHIDAIYTKDDESETLGVKLNDIDNSIQQNTAQLSEKANQSDLNIANTNIGNILLNNANGYKNVIYYNPSTNDILIGFKYGSNNDFFIEWQKCGVNSIMGMYKFYEASNTNKFVSSDILRSKNLLKTANTDFISPIVVKCNSSDTGYATQDFTGGWHGSSGEQSGNATAKTIVYEVYVNGEKLNNTDTVIKLANRIDIKVVNDIMAYNTKLSNGEGVYVIEETTIYTIIGNAVNVSTSLEALQNCTIYTYYGLQTGNESLWNQSITFPRGSSTSRLLFSTATNVDSGAKSSYPNVNRFVLKGSNGHTLIGFIDNSVGLGTRTNVDSTQPYFFNISYSDTDNTKTYANLIKGISNGLSLPKYNYVFWRGGYVFTDTSALVSNCDLFTIFNLYDNKSRVLFDCVTACGTTFNSNLMIGKNINTIVNTNSATINQIADGVNIINNATYGVVELDIVAQ